MNHPLRLDPVRSDLESQLLNARSRIGDIKIWGALSTWRELLIARPRRGKIMT